MGKVGKVVSLVLLCDSLVETDPDHGCSLGLQRMGWLPFHRLTLHWESVRFSAMALSYR